MTKSTPGAKQGKDKARADGTGSSKQGSGGHLAFIISSVLCVSLLAVYLVYFQTQDTSPLQSLSGAAVDDFLRVNDDGAIVYFYLKDCSHCQKLTPDLEQAVRQVQAAEGNSAPAFGSVNAGEEPAITQRFELSRYPAVVWIRKGEIMNELNPTSRSVDKIVEFVDWVRQPAVVNFETRAQFEEAVPTLRETMQDKTSAVIAGFAGFSDLYESLVQAAHRFRGKAVFVYVQEQGDSQDGAALRSITHSSDSDEFYTQFPVQRESVKRWVEKVIKGLKKEEPSSKQKEVKDSPSSEQRDEM
eukprot:TRINITY_DN40645_c0_g2_i1.p1 TRINITY_DN40645_c0_g2~~TRINITY_DN40645_c0_g2_i1.p1  ORF type:complete len:300 (-),score=57.51 TRINITY_DN40645_c0_g2_i1:176-1075(-)